MITRLRAGDGQRWRALRLQALREAPHAFSTRFAVAAQWDAARWEEQVSQIATFVAVVDDCDLAVARGAEHERSDTRELISMWVAPVARRQKLASRLIQHIRDWASAEGAAWLTLDVVENNAAALTLYERCGFVRSESQAEAGELRLIRSLT